MTDTGDKVAPANRDQADALREIATLSRQLADYAELWESNAMLAATNANRALIAEERLAEAQAVIERFKQALLTIQLDSASAARSYEGALANSRQALNLALLADGLSSEIKHRLRTAWSQVGDALGNEQSVNK